MWKACSLEKRLSPVRARAPPSFKSFRDRAPKAPVFVPTGDDLLSYWLNPYTNYDLRSGPYAEFYKAGLSKNIEAMCYVLVVEDQAWTLDLIRKQGILQVGDLEISWNPGFASPVEHALVSGGRDLGMVTVKRNGQDVPHSVTHSFVYFAFNRDGTIETESESGPVRF